jgi:hypothetical protein
MFLGVGLVLTGLVGFGYSVTQIANLTTQLLR